MAPAFAQLTSNWLRRPWGGAPCLTKYFLLKTSHSGQLASFHRELNTTNLALSSAGEARSGRGPRASRVMAKYRVPSRGETRWSARKIVDSRMTVSMGTLLWLDQPGGEAARRVRRRGRRRAAAALERGDAPGSDAISAKGRRQRRV